MSTGLSVLTIGAGDISLSFNPDNQTEMEESQKLIESMLTKGYTVMVKVGVGANGDPLFQRAVAFDKEHNEYLVVGTPNERKKDKTRKRVSASGTEAVAIAPTAKGCAPGPFRG